MSKKSKACKKCKVIVDGNECPICKGTNLSEGWKGRIIILKPGESEIAKHIKINQKGEFALKTK
ncbi:MAG: transcription elongation factor subunit Spt4 [archaeon]